jgi:hypothetical protein
MLGQTYPTLPWCALPGGFTSTLGGMKGWLFRLAAGMPGNVYLLEAFQVHAVDVVLYLLQAAPRFFQFFESFPMDEALGSEVPHLHQETVTKSGVNETLAYARLEYRARRKVLMLPRPVVISGQFSHRRLPRAIPSHKEYFNTAPLQY